MPSLSAHSGGKPGWAIYAVAVGSIFLQGAGVGWGTDPTVLDRLRADVEYLCSPALAGRPTPGEGGDLAARFIATRLAESGVAPVPSSDGSQWPSPAAESGYFQTVPIALRSLDTSAAEMEFDSGQARLRLRFGSDFLIFPPQPDDLEVSLPIVRCGYGVVNPNLARDDFGTVARGAAAVVWAGAGTLPADQVGPYSQAAFKAATAERAGVAMLLVVQPDGRPWPPPEVSDKLARYRRPIAGLTGGKPFLPLVYVRQQALSEFSTSLLPPHPDSRDYRPDRVPGVSVHLKVLWSEPVETPAVNVLGWIPGGSDWVVIVGAHYDHLGVDSTGFYPGADDNASGVAALLELCRRWKERPASGASLLVVAFAAEEPGLLGSRHLATHLPIPRPRLLAMVNLDMVGRKGYGNMRDLQSGKPPPEDYSGVFFSAASPALREPLKAAVDLAELDVELRPTSAFRHFGDAGSFHDAGIPTVHVFSGFHQDYHRPTDTPDRLDYVKMARMIDLIQRIVDNLAGLNAAIPFNPAEQVEPGVGVH